MAQFAHYIRREVAEPDYCSPSDPWFAENQPDTQGFFSPTYHAAPGNSGIAKRIFAGDTIWLFSQLSSQWGRLPPALDGIVEVAGKSAIKRDDHSVYRFAAGPGSRWFPLCDATNLLQELGLLSGSIKTVGQALRFMRRIDDPAPLLRHRQKVDALPVDFISYRLLDGTCSAFHLARRLLREQRAVAWDRWSLPRRLAERREFLSDEALNNFIQRLVCRSQVVYGVCSPRYAEPGSYSRRERDLAQSLGIYRAHTDRQT